MGNIFKELLLQISIFLSSTCKTFFFFFNSSIIVHYHEGLAIKEWSAYLVPWLK